MKVIDLLNKIANGEKVPKKIMFNNIVWEYEEYIRDYRSRHNFELFFDDEINNKWVIMHLNTEVEIIEEEIIEEETKPITKESIEALGYACGEIKKCFANGWNKSLENKPLTEEDKKIKKIDINYYSETPTESILHNKIDEIIDILNEMREDK